jgi:glutathione transport system ATP-binding protein
MLHAGDIDVLKVEGLSIARDQDRERIGIVDDVSFSIASGEALALVGEGGSGKRWLRQRCHRAVAHAAARAEPAHRRRANRGARRDDPGPDP